MTTDQETSEARETGPPSSGAEMKWYVVHTYSGHENKVKTYIERSTQAQGVEALFGRVLIPTEEVVEMRGGEKRTTTKKFYPSYVLIEMVITDQTQHLVNSTPGVTSFVGVGRRPEPLKSKEIASILGQLESAKSRPAAKVPFKVGESVLVGDGPFSEFSGVVDEINAERGTVKVMVSIFGRPTPVELDFLQVKSA
jgi:transcriptional antiterminator NusG